MNLDDLSQEELNLLAYTLLGEAGGEGRRGMEAVMHVIKNRSESPRWSDNPALVAIQKNTKGVHQFSTWNSSSLGGNNPTKFSTNSSAFREALSVVKDVLGGESVDPTRGATHFYANSMAQPYWWTSEAPKGAVKIGNHFFGARRDEAAPVPAVKPAARYLEIKRSIEEAISDWENPEPTPAPRLNRTIFRAPVRTEIPLGTPRPLTEAIPPTRVAETLSMREVNKGVPPSAYPTVQPNATPGVTRATDLNPELDTRPRGPVTRGGRTPRAPLDIGVPAATFPASEVGREEKISPEVPPRPNRGREPILVDTRGNTNLAAEREEKRLLRTEANRKREIIAAEAGFSIPMLSDNAPSVDEWFEENGVEKPVVAPGVGGRLRAEPRTTRLDAFGYGEYLTEKNPRLEPGEEAPPGEPILRRENKGAEGKIGLYSTLTPPVPLIRTAPPVPRRDPRPGRVVDDGPLPILTGGELEAGVDMAAGLDNLATENPNWSEMANGVNAGFGENFIRRRNTNALIRYYVNGTFEVLPNGIGIKRGEPNGTPVTESFRDRSASIATSRAALGNAAWAAIRSDVTDDSTTRRAEENRTAGLVR